MILLLNRANKIIYLRYEKCLVLKNVQFQTFWPKAFSHWSSLQIHAIHKISIMKSLHLSSGYLPRQCALPSNRRQQPFPCHVRHAAFVPLILKRYVHELPLRYHVARASAIDDDEGEEELEDDFEDEETSSDEEDEDDDDYVAASTDPSDWVEVGVVGPPHGVRGEFKMQPLTDFPEERLGEPGPRWLQAPPPKLGKLSSRSPPEPMDLEWGRTTIYTGREL